MTQTTERADITETLRTYGDFAHGGDPEGVATDWIESGQADRMGEWLDAGVFDADAAARLAALGLTPEQVAVDYEHAGQTNTLGYWVANGDLYATDAAEIVAQRGKYLVCDDVDPVRYPYAAPNPRAAVEQYLSTYEWGPAPGDDTERVFAGRVYLDGRLVAEFEATPEGIQSFASR